MTLRSAFLKDLLKIRSKGCSRSVQLGGTHTMYKLSRATAASAAVASHPKLGSLFRPQRPQICCPLPLVTALPNFNGQIDEASCGFCWKRSDRTSCVCVCLLCCWPRWVELYVAPVDFPFVCFKDAGKCSTCPRYTRSLVARRANWRTPNLYAFGFHEYSLVADGAVLCEMRASA